MRQNAGKTRVKTASKRGKKAGKNRVKTWEKSG
jgi:hypothetical protein